MGQSYLDLAIYKDSLNLFLRTHRFSLKLPKYETYELGSQLRRSADSVNSNIVEGYGRRSYKGDFLRFLHYAYSSNLETTNHLQKIEALYPNLSPETSILIEGYNKLGRQLYKFIAYVKRSWRTQPTTKNQ